MERGGSLLGAAKRVYSNNRLMNFFSIQLLNGIVLVFNSLKLFLQVEWPKRTKNVCLMHKKLSFGSFSFLLPGLVSKKIKRMWQI